MATNLINKLVSQAEKDNGTYVDIIFSDSGIAFTSDAGKRKSTKNFKLTEKEIISYERTLKSLDERCLLFCRLKRIEIRLRDGRRAYFEKCMYDDSIVVITACKVTETKEKLYKWVITEIDDGRVAFQIKDTKNKKYDTVPSKGGWFEGIFESEEETDLLFCMSGSLDEIKAALSKFIRSTVGLRINLLSLYNVLPSTMDDDCEWNMELVKTVKETFNSGYPLFKNTIGRIVAKNRIMIGTEEVTSLFPHEICAKILDSDKCWLIPCEEGSRAEYFIIDIGVTKYDRESFLELIFDDFCLDELEKILEKQNDKWLRNFYIFCSKPILEDKVRRIVYSGLRNIRSIRDTKGKMYFPNEISIAKDGDDALKNSVIIRKSLISPNGIDDEYTVNIKELFENALNIVEYSQKPEMEQLAIDLSTKKQAIDERYAEKLVQLALYDKSHIGVIAFSEYSLFPYESSRGLRRVKASEIVIGRPYVKEGNLLSRAMDRPELWKGFKSLVDAENLELILAFAERHGAVGMPCIIEQRAEKHIKYSEQLFVQGKQLVRDTNFDYTIPGLDEILKKRSLQLNRLIWKCIINVDKSFAEEVVFAEYSCNNRETVNRAESSLIQILKQRVWVPDKNNKLHAPADIKIADISEELVFDRRNPILKELQFGSAVKQREDEIKRLNKLVESVGMKLVDADEYQEFLDWKSRQ